MACPGDFVLLADSVNQKQNHSASAVSHNLRGSTSKCSASSWSSPKHPLLTSSAPAPRALSPDEASRSCRAHPRAPLARSRRASVLIPFLGRFAALSTPASLPTTSPYAAPRPRTTARASPAALHWSSSGI